MKSPLKSLMYCMAGVTLSFNMALLVTRFGSEKNSSFEKVKDLYEKLDKSIQQASDINKKENTNALFRNGQNFLSELEHFITLPETQEEEIQSHIEKLIEKINSLLEIEDSFEENEEV